MSSDAIQYIHQQWPEAVVYARDVLGWPVNKAGDRWKSLEAGSNKTCLEFRNNGCWVDYKTGQSGDIIDLCALVRHNGDKGAAIRELAGDFYTISTEYVRTVTRIEEHFRDWHRDLIAQARAADSRAELRGTSLVEYLHSRKITDNTIKRLQLGYDKNDERLMIPYIKNGRIVYWVGRDMYCWYNKAAHDKEVERLKAEGKSRGKYKKMYCGKDGIMENIPWGLHTFTKTHKEQLSQMAFDFDGQGHKHYINRNDWVIITEGAFDALSFEQEGFQVLSSMGGYFSGTAKQQVISLCRNAKNVFVCFDRDDAGQNFQRDMCKMLFQYRVNFFCGVLPAELNGQPVKDVSDYYTAGGSLDDLVASARPGLGVLAGLMDSRSEFTEFCRAACRYVDKAVMAELFELAEGVFGKRWVRLLQSECFRAPAESQTVKEVQDEHVLRFLVNDGFYEYMHGEWRRQSDLVIQRYAAERLGRYATGGRMQGVCNHIKAMSAMNTDFEFNTQHVLSFVNGTLDLNTLELHKHSANYNCSIQLPYAYQPEAQCLHFEEFVADIMQENDDKIACVQEMCGYILWPDNKLEKGFFLMGDGGNGKSVLMEVLSAVISPRNVSNVEISTLSSQFEPIALRGKLLNFSRESRTNLKDASATWKAIISGDPIRAAHKGVDSVEFRPRCKMICACNDFINTNDMTHSFLRRLIFIMFNNNYEQEGKADPNLSKKLLTEIPGILNWCIKGYLRLRKRVQEDAAQKFTITRECEAKKQEFMTSINPVAAYIEDSLMDVWGISTTTKELYPQYRSWCSDNGYQVMSSMRFARVLKDTLRMTRPDVQFQTGGNHLIIFPSGV